MYDELVLLNKNDFSGHVSVKILAPRSSVNSTHTCLGTRASGFVSVLLLFCALGSFNNYVTLGDRACGA